MSNKEPLTHLSENRGTNMTKLLDYLKEKKTKHEAIDPALMEKKQADKQKVASTDVNHRNILQEGKDIDKSNNEHNRKIAEHVKAKKMNVGMRKQNKENIKDSNKAKKTTCQLSNKSTKAYKVNKHRINFGIPNTRKVIHKREVYKVKICKAGKTNLRMFTTTWQMLGRIRRRLT